MCPCKGARAGKIGENQRSECDLKYGEWVGGPASCKLTCALTHNSDLLYRALEAEIQLFLPNPWFEWARDPPGQNPKVGPSGSHKQTQFPKMTQVSFETLYCQLLVTLLASYALHTRI